MRDFNRFFGRQLARARGHTPFNQQQLGELIGVAQGQVGLYERGKNMPLLYRLPILCRTLGVSSDSLIGLTDNDYFIPADAEARLRLATVRRLQVASTSVINVVSQVLTLGTMSEAENRTVGRPINPRDTHAGLG